MKYLAVFVLLFIGSVLGAQSFTISGRVVDAGQQGLPGATVSLQQPWGDPVKNTSTEPDGRFEFKGIGKGGYKIVVTAMGFKRLLKEVTLSGADAQLGTLSLEEDAVLLNGVEIKSTVPTAQQKGDTIEFNSTAFKVMKDANADELIEKLPRAPGERNRRAIRLECGGDGRVHRGAGEKTDHQHADDAAHTVNAENIQRIVVAKE